MLAACRIPRHLIQKVLDMFTKVVVFALVFANLTLAATEIAKFSMQEGQMVTDVYEVGAEPV